MSGEIVAVIFDQKEHFLLIRKRVNNSDQSWSFPSFQGWSCPDCNRALLQKTLDMLGLKKEGYVVEERKPIKIGKSFYHPRLISLKPAVSLDRVVSEKAQSRRFVSCDDFAKMSNMISDHQLLFEKVMK